ncbi:MAG: endo-1,4-beta-xylanase [Ignavibacteriaceae bacterium]
MKRYLIFMPVFWPAGFLLLFFAANFSTFAQEIPLLKDAFKEHFLIGAAVNQDHFFEKDEIGAGLIKEHFNSITPENHLKWMNIHPKSDEYSFEAPDRFVEFGEKNNMVIIGHTLVWHNQTPRWVFEDENGDPVSRDTLLNRMRDHIYTVVGRYKGRIKGWDVVNEALNEDGSLRQSPWLKIIGEDFIEKAFQYADEADPEAELYYNDYSLENEPKRNGAVKLVKSLKEKGIRISGVGTQHHIKMNWPSKLQIDSTIKAFAELGMDVMITELDIDVLPQPSSEQGAEVTRNFELKEQLNPYADALPDSVQQALAERYAEIFEVFLKNSDKISRVTFWGVTDKESWLNNWPVYGRTSYPLLFNRNGEPKPAFDAVIQQVKKQNSNM